MKSNNQESISNNYKISTKQSEPTNNSTYRINNPHESTSDFIIYFADNYEKQNEYINYLMSIMV